MIPQRSKLALALTGGLLVDWPGQAADDQKSRIAYDFAFTSIEGDAMPLSEFRGRVIMVVNTASFCGFTGQYEGLVALWRRYREKGFVLVGAPSNDFGGQEPGSNAEVKDFCTLTYGVDFPMTAKVRVTGPNAHPFYKWAARKLGSSARPRWNFHKYLIGRDGRLVDWFATTTSPDAGRLVRAIEVELRKPAPPAAASAE